AMVGGEAGGDAAAGEGDPRPGSGWPRRLVRRPADLTGRVGGRTRHDRKSPIHVGTELPAPRVGDHITDVIADSHQRCQADSHRRQAAWSIPTAVHDTSRTGHLLTLMKAREPPGSRVVGTGAAGRSTPETRPFDLTWDDGDRAGSPDLSFPSRIA